LDLSKTYVLGDMGGFPGSYLAGFKYMSGSTGDSATFRPAISGLTSPRVMILNSVLLELRDLPEEMLEDAEGRFVVA
jgi:hypothetical protein